MTNKESNRLALGIDIDEVLAPYLDYFLLYFQRVHGVQLSIDHFSYYDIGKALHKAGKRFTNQMVRYFLDPPMAEKYGYTKQEIKSSNELLTKLILADFHESPEFQSIVPDEETIKMIQILAKYFDLVAITSRQIQIREATNEWIHHYFPGCFASVICCNEMSLKGKKVPKKTFVERFRLVAMIEDSVRTLLECDGLDTFKLGILMRRNWSATVEKPQKTIRVDNLRAAVLILIRFALDTQTFSSAVSLQLTRELAAMPHHDLRTASINVNLY